jgi:hypothetical protein
LDRSEKAYRQKRASSSSDAPKSRLLAFTTQLILDDYLIHFAEFMLVTMSALVVGNAVLITNALPLFRRFHTAPIVQPVLFKTTIYFAVVFLVRFFEKLVKYWFAGGSLAERGGAFLVAPVCRYPSLDLDSVSVLHYRCRVEFVVWSTRVNKNTLHKALLRLKVKQAPTGLATTTRLLLSPDDRAGIQKFAYALFS